LVLPEENEPKTRPVSLITSMRLQYLLPGHGSNQFLFYFTTFSHMYNHSACAIGQSVMMFGGFDGRQAANTFATITADFGYDVAF